MTSTTDMISLIIMFCPLVIVYETGILIVKLDNYREKKKAKNKF